MGNVCSTQRRRNVSKWIQTRFKRPSTNVDDNNAIGKHHTECRVNINEKGVNGRQGTGSDDGIAEIYTEQKDDRDSPHSDTRLHAAGVFAFEDEVADFTKTNVSHRRFNGFGERMVESRLNVLDDRDETVENECNGLATPDVGMDDDQLTNSSRSLSSFGVCAFEGERKPKVKAIYRIKRDHASIMRLRKGPIPEEERRGSIRDLRWSRHVTHVDNLAQKRVRLGNTIMAGLQMGNYVSKTNRRFNKCTDIKCETEEGGYQVSPGLQHRTHGFMAQTDNMVVMETDKDPRGGILRRQKTYNNLPDID